jgi:hypothetical protein
LSEWLGGREIRLVEGSKGGEVVDGLRHVLRRVLLLKLRGLRVETQFPTHIGVQVDICKIWELSLWLVELIEVQLDLWHWLCVHLYPMTHQTLLPQSHQCLVLVRHSQLLSLLVQQVL